MKLPWISMDTMVTALQSLINSSTIGTELLYAYASEEYQDVNTLVNRQLLIPCSCLKTT